MDSPGASMKYRLTPLAWLLSLSLAVAPLANATTQTHHKKVVAPQTTKAKAAAPKRVRTTLQAGAKPQRVVVATRKTAIRKASLRRTDPDMETSLGQLALRSNSALIIRADTGDVLFEKNSGAVVPIASLTKLMTAVVLLDSKLALDMPVTVEDGDVDMLRHSLSHLPVGVTATREELLRLALMASENRAAAALARTYPGGLPAFVARMNRKAASLGMTHTHYGDSTGLSNDNYSTAQDLAKLVAAASQYPLIREFTTTDTFTFNPLAGGRPRQYANTNPLVKSDNWDIAVSKTGFTNEAGKCLVMKANIGKAPVVIVLLDATGSQTRIGDANRVRKWLEAHPEVTDHPESQVAKVTSSAT